MINAPKQRITERWFNVHSTEVVIFYHVRYRAIKITYVTKNVTFVTYL